MKAPNSGFPLFLLWFLAMSVSSCRDESATGELPPVPVGNPDGNYVVPGVLGGIVYRRVEGIELQLDAYIQNSADIRPAVLVVHGGGWSSGSRIAFVGQFLEMLTEAGFNWFSLDYRLAPTHHLEDSLDDLRTAVEFIRLHHAFFRIDPGRLAVLGEDSGGHLAALLATERPDQVAALVTFGAPLDLASLEGPMREAALRALAVTSGDPNHELDRASPLERLLEGGIPPVLAVHGTADKEVPPGQSERFCQSVRALDETCEFLGVPGAIHRPENWPPSQWTYKRQVVDWLKRLLQAATLEPKPYEDLPLRKNLVFGSYEDAGGVVRPLQMDAWIPEGDGPFPGVIIVHGGGWEAGDKVTYVTPVFEPLARAGFAWFSIDYRLTPEFRNRDQLEDLRRAIRFVRHHQEEFRVDPDRLAVLGESASGQMVVQLASQPCPGDAASQDDVDRESCEVQGVVSFYGVYDFLPMVKDVSPRSLAVRLFGLDRLDREAEEVLRQYSPIYQVHANMPPLLLIHGTNEYLWEQAQQLENRLRAVGADFELVALDGAPHGMENWEGHPEWEVYKEHLVKWLQATGAGR